MLDSVVVESSGSPFIPSRIFSSDHWLFGMDTYASQRSGHRGLLALTSHKTRSDASMFSSAKRFSFLMARCKSLMFWLSLIVTEKVCLISSPTIQQLRVNLCDNA